MGLFPWSQLALVAGGRPDRPDLHRRHLTEPRQGLVAARTAKDAGRQSHQKSRHSGLTPNHERPEPQGFRAFEW